MKQQPGKGIQPGTLCLVVGFKSQPDWNGLTCTAIKQVPVGYVTRELFLDSFGNPYAVRTRTKAMHWEVEFRQSMTAVLKSSNSGNVYHSLPSKYQLVPAQHLVPLSDPDAEDTTPAYDSNPLLLEGPTQ